MLQMHCETLNLTTKETNIMSTFKFVSQRSSLDDFFYSLNYERRKKEKNYPISKVLLMQNDKIWGKIARLASESSVGMVMTALAV